MRRRTLIAAIGTLSAGCFDGPRDATGARSPTGTTTSSGDALLITDLEVRTTTERPSVQYVLEPAAFYAADAVARERNESKKPVVVMDVADVEDPEVRAVLEEALPDGEWRGNTLPDGLADLLERVDFFTGLPKDATYTHIGLELYRFYPNRPPPIEFDATIADDRVSSGDPGALEFSLTNTGKRTQEVFSGTVPPFGVVSAGHVDGPGRFLLWRDYETEGCVTFTEDGIARCAIGRITPIEPGASVTRRYAILPATTEHYPDRTVPPNPGQYRIPLHLSYSTGSGAPSSKLNATTTVRLTRAG